MSNSFAPEVIADSTGKWCGNALRFATREEAEANVEALMMRWFSVTDTRVVESDDPVNYRWVDHHLEAVEKVCPPHEVPIDADNCVKCGAAVLAFNFGEENI